MAFPLLIVRYKYDPWRNCFLFRLWFEEQNVILRVADVSLIISNIVTWYHVDNCCSSERYRLQFVLQESIDWTTNE